MNSLSTRSAIRRGQRLPTLIALETAFPKNCYAQEEIFEHFFTNKYDDVPLAKRIFRNAGVKTRHSHADLEALGKRLTMPTGERMGIWKEGVMDLGRQNMQAVLQKVDPQRIGSFTMGSCTGYDQPSPEMLLAQEFNLAPHVRTAFLGHMGCAAAFNTLKIGLDSLAARPDEVALVYNVEICLVHARSERNTGQAVMYALFGDGGAMAALSMEEEAIGPKILGTHMELLRGTYDCMTWSIGADGFRMEISPEVPCILGETVVGFVDRMMASVGLRREDISHWALHPGGPKILQMVGAALGLDEAQTRASRTVLANYGNCSSPTILMVLREMLNTDRPEPGSYGILLGFGPGMTMQGMILQF